MFHVKHLLLFLMALMVLIALMVFNSNGFTALNEF